MPHEMKMQLTLNEILKILVVKYDKENLSDHDLIYRTRKTSLPKSHKDDEIFVHSVKSYSSETFLDILREIVFPNYLTYTSVNDAYSGFTYGFVGAINFIAPANL